MDIFSGLQTFEPCCTTPSFRLINTYDCDCLLQRDVVKEPATTVVGFIFKEGVIMAAADSSSQSVKKIVEINTHMLGTGAADCQSWYKYLGIKCRLYELENERRISLTRASSLLKSIVYSDHHCVGLSAEIVIAGWDEKGPGLYYVQYDVGKIEGVRFSVGSGSRAANFVLDRGYRYDMTIDEAAGLARRSITFPYGASGGSAIYYVGPDGWKKLSGDDGGPDGSKKLSGPEWKKFYGDVGGPEELKKFYGDADGWKKSSGPESKKLKLSGPDGWKKLSGDDGGPDGSKKLSGPECKKLKLKLSGPDGSKKLSGPVWKRFYGDVVGPEDLKRFYGDGGPREFKKFYGDDGGPDGWKNLSGLEILEKLSSGEDGGPHGWKKCPGGWMNVSVEDTGGTSRMTQLQKTFNSKNAWAFE